MANQEIHASSEDDELSRFVTSVRQKIECNKTEGMTDPHHAGPWIPVMYRVPDVVREQNENAYSPTIISIGPLHRGKERLQAMEPIKLSYMGALLERTTAPWETIEVCAAAMLGMENLVKSFYEPSTENVSLQANTENVRLAEVMLTDSCFIIELLLRNYEEDDFDPILQNPFKYYAVQRDLLLLENQIPFFVLKKLLEMMLEKMVKKSPEIARYPKSLNEFVFFFYGDILDQREKMKDISSPCHFLHLYHKYYVPPGTDKYEYASNFQYINEERTENKFSATELRLRGVELKAGEGRNLFDIKFTTTSSCCNFFLFTKGRLEISPFSISESTESFLRNLIDFEISCPWTVDHYFTSLAFLMDLLIDTPEDVQLFEEAGIIRNYLGSREEVAQLFNGICKNSINPSAFLYRKQYKKAMNFCKPWRASAGKLRHEYFGNPWAGISVIAAIILFVLTLISTLYTILAYY